MIRAVVVEGEPPARSYLVDLLTRTGRVEVVGEAGDARDGLRLCRQPGVDAVFLAIRLPGPDGLTLGKMLNRLPQPPLLIFVTGFADYAVAAFQVHAVDYLLKPVQPKRVEEAVRYLKQRLCEQRAGCVASNRDSERSERQGRAPERSAGYPRSGWMAPEDGERLPVHDRHRDLARLLARHEIVAVLRCGRRTWIHTADGEYPSYYSVARVAAWLGGAPFLRAAREAVVNLEAVAEIIHYGDRLYQLRLKDRQGTVITASRSGARCLASSLKPHL